MVKVIVIDESQALRNYTDLEFYGGALYGRNKVMNSIDRIDSPDVFSLATLEQLMPSVYSLISEEVTRQVGMAIDNVINEMEADSGIVQEEVGSPESDEEGDPPSPYGKGRKKVRP
jgi:hypothetical protein